ncbi:MAG TPA: hypothetical protein PLE74_04835 [Candidatus Cloacimonadota bacterium]|nr:hypothetical protein [Candidatus Cloacimonadota bacterium]HPT71586.1 hypothetical protein [Candidatus Cloacimonadota bacterium]
MKKVLLPILLLMAISFMFAVESAPSAIVGYVKYQCDTNENGGLNLIALPFVIPYTQASELGDAIGTDNIDAISYWDAANQYWLSASWPGEWVDDFPIASNDVLLVNYILPAPTTTYFYAMGSLASNPVYSFDLNANGGLNTMMVPLNQASLTTASALGNSIGAEAGNIDAISYWDTPNQTWFSATWPGEWVDDFPISIGMPLLVNITSSGVVWPGTKNVQNLKASRASK